MPVYAYNCQTCEKPFEKRLRISSYDEPQSCPFCDSTDVERVMSQTSFILRGDGWAGKNHRINRQMKQKNQRLSGKQNDRKRDAPVVTLAPNVDGERVDSWSDAKKLAASKGKETSSYDSYIRKEKSTGGKA